MKKKNWLLVGMALATLSFSGAVRVVDGAAGDEPVPGKVAFEKIKSLAGEWQAPQRNDAPMINIFRPMAFGTAMLHEEWKNGEQLTATVFYLVGSELRADHFCDFYNQPRYTVKPSSDPNVLAFEMREATNLDAHPRHFRGTTWHLVDATHHTQDWEIVEPGKPARHAKLEFTRTK